MRSFRKIEHFRVEKNAFKNIVYEKRMTNVNLKGLKQGLNVQDKKNYLAFTAK